MGLVKKAEDDTLESFYATVYLPTVVGSSKAWKAQIGWAMDRYIRPAFGKMELAEIDRHQVQAFFNKLDMRVSSKKRVRIVLSGVLNLALDDGIITKNPALRIRFPREEKPEKKILDWPDLRDLLNRTPDEFKPIVVAMMFGARVSEACALMKSDIRDGALCIERQIDGCDRTKPLKTESSKRKIPLPEKAILEILKGREGLILAPNADGRFYVRSNIARMLREIDGPNPHLLRHTFASLLENELEAPRRIVGALVGHAGKGVGDVYSHTFTRQLLKWTTLYWEKIVNESVGQKLSYKVSES